MHTCAALFTANKTHVSVSRNSISRLPCIYVRPFFTRVIMYSWPTAKSLFKTLVLKLFWVTVVTENHIGG
jgi:hypothetical protein